MRGIVLVPHAGQAIAARLDIVATRSRVTFVEKKCPLSAASRRRVVGTLTSTVQRLTGCRAGWRLACSLGATLRHARTRVEGESADLAFALAQWSAAKRVPLRTDIAAIGTLERDGSIGIVRGLDAKLTLEDSNIRVVLVPDWESDLAFRELHASEYVAVRTQVKATFRHVRIVRSFAEACAAARQPAIRPQITPLRLVHRRASRVVVASSPDSSRLEAILSACNEPFLRAEIDERLEERFASFAPRTRPVRSAYALLRVAAQLLRHVGAIRGDAQTRRTQAARLLDGAFPSGGFRAAFDLAQRSGAAARVLGIVVDHLKRHRRRMFVEGVLAQCLAPEKPLERLELTRALLARFPELATYPQHSAEHFVHDLASLIEQASAVRAGLARQFSP
jgi:hypothetical protein